ncbi:tudor domain-containing 6 [Syngnathus acus]|uniref:tudor domain-containing 6 n=1 Tax=Syngnathus acus TaxID=161584 RepID=UPI0018864D86|nr:tudor domain-containing 6 [Syngnathus acus]
MSSIPPAQGSDVTILITKVDSYPVCTFIEFWANFGLASATDYQSLAENIQSPVNIFQEFEGNPGDLCLIHIDGTWYRSRIVTRNGSNCQVLLIDKGITCSTSTKLLAWGKKEHFRLPPEVELCVLANIWPHAPENRWSPFALEFMQTLRGKTVKAHVQDVLVKQRKFLLDIPYITGQMYEMGLAKKLDPRMFLDFVLLPDSKTEAEKFHQTSIGEIEQLHKKDLYMFPKLSTGAVETVVVTEVTNPQRIFCQLKIFTEELKGLSEQITQRCKGRMVSCTVGPEMIGFPCAARAHDGNWYRSLLQQVFPGSQLAEVLNVDYGTKQVVQIENLRPLAPEFFKMPVVTYVCSLYGIYDKGVGWTSKQINYLKSLLLHKTLIAKFQYQSIAEGVYYVTLYGDKNINLNTMFCSQENSLLESRETLCDYPTRNMTYRIHHPPQFQITEGTMLPSGLTNVVEAKTERLDTVENILPGSCHVARVSHVSHPAEFWIQMQNCANELDELIENIFQLYKSSDGKHVTEAPALGACCAAKASDGNFYRVIVLEVGETKIKVFFMDYGDTEEVDGRDIRTLPDALKQIPRLALKCSLAGLRPKGLGWSSSAIKVFIKMITDKLLNVHVMEKHNDTFVVTLTDPKSQEEKDIGRLLCSSGLAEYDEMKKTSRISTEKSETGFLKESGASFKTQDKIHSPSEDLQIAKFKENMFTVGSILDVNVSCIESPNSFWCQLVKYSDKLQSLMYDMQAHYAGSIFEPLRETACVVRHPQSGCWYRGLVIRKHQTTHVTVLFVDYGQTTTVSLHNVRNIRCEFFDLPSQAFRCGLYNPLEVMSVEKNWNDKGKEKFLNFVKTATSNFVPLKCTVYAVMYNEEKLIVNIVDLETPFESICTSMAELALFTPGRKVHEASYRLDTYYHSTHNVKVGTEEQVTVTCVNSVGQFYCQLEKNADALKDLNKTVNNLCSQLGNVKPPPLFQKLCFAKYTDGLWYRAQIKATQPSILVHFVDYGNTAEVDKSDLIPVPKEAKDIMSVPVQAVMCRLSDVPLYVPSEVNNWFEKSVTDCQFKALVLAREPDGSLLVELYHNGTQINSKMKDIFRLQKHTDPYQHPKAPQNANRGKEAMSLSPQVIQKDNTPDPKPAHQATRPSRANLQTEQTVKNASKELYRPPNQRQNQNKHIRNTENTENLPNSTLDTKSPPKHGNLLPQSDDPKLPKLEDLPKNSITLDMEADVYISHYNSPTSFYVQLVREEDEIFSLQDKLNDPPSTPKISITKVDVGDLVQAVFPDDSLWYRAVVKQVLSNSLALVEYVDFGDMAELAFSKLAKLNQAFVQLPRYSTHCMLSKAGSLEPLDAEVVSTLRNHIGSNAEKILKCQFVQLSDVKWRVTLEDNGVQVTCQAPAGCPDIPSDSEHEMENSSENSPNFNSLCYQHLKFTEGQQLDVYISVFCDAHKFWCQLADTLALDEISKSLSEIGNAAYDTRALSPGTPCIAFYAEDQLWYRAEVLGKDGDVLSVVFVDYGNTAEITGTDVREITPDLLQTPLQAFLCKLEGFDESHGSWNAGASDELFSIAQDKLLQMTVTREDGKNMYVVKLECEGQRLNETMKKWWMTPTLENKPDVGKHMLDEKLDSIDASGKKTENETPKSENTRGAAHVGMDQNYAVVTSTPKDFRSHVNFLHSSILSTVEELCVSEIRSLNETSEEVNTVATLLIPEIETSVSQLDSGIQENVLPLKTFEKNIIESDQDFVEAANESGIPWTPFEVADNLVCDCSVVGTCSDDPNVSTDDKKVANPAMSGKNVTMVCLDAVVNNVVPEETAVDTSEGSELIPSESFLVPVVQQLQDAPEQQNEDDVIPQHEDTHAKEMNAATIPNETFEENASSDPPPFDTDIFSESHIGTVSVPDVAGALAEKVIDSDEALTDPDEQSDGVMTARNRCHISVTREEMVPNEPLLPFDSPIEQVIALSFDAEAGYHTHLCPDEKDVEEVICLIKDMRLTDAHNKQVYEAAMLDQEEVDLENWDDKDSSDAGNAGPLSPDDSAGDVLSDPIQLPVVVKDETEE